MSSRARTDERLPALDGLRGLMAFAVALYHYSMWAPWTSVGTPGNTLLASLGLYSVQGFFILSGFCFCLLYRDVRFTAPELARFHVKRFFRIAPLYYASLFVCLAMHITVGPEPTPLILLENLSLSFGFVHPNHALVAGGWSIGVEYVFYAALPLALWVARVRYGLLLLFAALVLLAVGASERVWLVPSSQRFHAYVQVPNHAFLFALGALLAALRARSSWRVSAWCLPLAGACISALVWSFVSPVPDHFLLVTGWARVAGVGACAVLVACAGLSRPEPPLLARIYTRLGELSFAVYMLHHIAYVLARPAFVGLSGALPCFAALALAVALGALVHRVLERPMITLGARLARRVPTRAEPVPVLSVDAPPAP